MNEQRKVERFDLYLEIMLRVQKPTKGNQTQTLLSRNISSAGVFLVTNDPLLLGTNVDLGLFISQKFYHNEKRGKIVINTRGTVIRNDKLGMAIKFDTKCQISPFNLAPKIRTGWNV